MPRKSKNTIEVEWMGSFGVSYDPCRAPFATPPGRQSSAPIPWNHVKAFLLPAVVVRIGLCSHNLSSWNWQHSSSAGYPGIKTRDQM